MEPQWDGGNESLFAGSGSRSPRWPPRPHKVKNLFLQNQRENDLVTWYVAWGLGSIVVCSNDGPRLNLTYFTARSNLVPYAFIWGKTVRKSFNGRNLQQMARVTKGLC